MQGDAGAGQLRCKRLHLGKAVLSAHQDQYHQIALDREPAEAFELLPRHKVFGGPEMDFERIAMLLPELSRRLHQGQQVAGDVGRVCYARRLHACEPSLLRYVSIRTAEMMGSALNSSSRR